MDIVIKIAASTAVLFLGAFGVMLALGAAHSEYGGVPPLGYLTVLWLLVGLSWAWEVIKFDVKDL